MLQIKCPHCGMVHNAPPEVVGKQVTCKACHKPFRAPRPQGTGAPPPVYSAARPWSLHVDGETQGPYSLKTVIEQVQEGKADGATLAWKDGMDDWTPLRELVVFHDALEAARASSSSSAIRRSAAGSAVRSSRIGARVAEEEGGERPHRHYRRGRGKRDMILGAWIAGAMAAIALVVVLVVTNMPEPVVELPPPPPTPRAANPQAPTAPAAPTPKAKRPKPKTSTIAPAKRLARAIRTLERRFPAAIAGHKKGDPRPIGRLIRDCEIYADSLSKLPWGAHQKQMSRFIAVLKERAAAIHDELKTKPWCSGGLGVLGVDEKTKVESLRLNETQWLENNIRILKNAIQKLRDSGLAT